MKSINNYCELVGRCGGHWGYVRRLWGSVTVVKCGSSKGSVSSIRKVCQWTETCDGEM